MKFTTEEEKQALITGFETKCTEIAIEKKCGKVTFETVTDEEGNIYVAYFKQPHEVTAARAMDCLSRQNIFEAGNTMWAGAFLRDFSSPEIESVSKYKLGMIWACGRIIDIQLPDVKKK